MPIIQPMSASDIALSDDFERELMLDSAREQSVGGNIWKVERSVGGESEPATDQDEPNVQGWVCRSKPKVVEVNGALFQPDDQWLMVLNGTPALQEQWVITSAIDDSYVFLVMSLEQRRGYAVAILEETG